MEYRYKKMEKEYGDINFKRDGIWHYIPLQTFLDTGKDKESIIFGDVTGVTGNGATNCVSMQEGGEKKSVRLFRYRGRLSILDTVIGYIPVVNPQGKEGYVRIRKKSHKKMLLAVVTMLVVLTAGFYALNNKQGPDLDSNAIAYQLPDGVKNTDPESILLPGYDVLPMKYTTQKVDTALLNPEGNDCYFKFSILLKSDETMLYQTGLIKPGMAVTSFKINKKLEKGEYPVIIKVEATDLEEEDNIYNGGAIEATLEVK